MRGVLPVMLLLAALLGGCRQEPSFDERYAAAEKRIRKTEQGITRELRTQPCPSTSATTADPEADTTLAPTPAC